MRVAAAGDVEVAGETFRENRNQAELQERAPSKWMKEKPPGSLNGW